MKIIDFIRIIFSDSEHRFLLQRAAHGLCTYMQLSLEWHVRRPDDPRGHAVPAARLLPGGVQGGLPHHRLLVPHGGLDDYMMQTTCSIGSKQMY